MNQKNWYNAAIVYGRFFKALPTGLITLALIAGPVWGQDQGQLERQLEQLRGQIAELTRQNRSTQQLKDQEVASLQRVESEISELGRDIRRLDTELGGLEVRLATLGDDERQLRLQLSDQQDALAAQLRSSHAFGRQPRLKLMLDLNDPGQLGRVFNYYRYYAQARLSLMNQIGSQLEQLNRLLQQQTRLRDQLATDRKHLDDTRKGREQARIERRSIVEELRKALASQRRKLGTLGQDQQRLSNLLQQLQDLLAEVPAGFSSAPFDSLRGRLSWPVSGRLALAPGTEKSNGMRRQAAVIAAEPGSPVKTVSYGRVAYADWLRGFGLLAIIDHGDGFMSLYGFNETLLVDVGDWVQAGEIIAEVGRSGAQERDALYFEIRQDGQPVNPLPWFSTSDP